MDRAGMGGLLIALGGRAIRRITCRGERSTYWSWWDQAGSAGLLVRLVGVGPIYGMGGEFMPERSKTEGDQAVHRDTHHALMP